MLLVVGAIVEADAARRAPTLNGGSGHVLVCCRRPGHLTVRGSQAARAHSGGLRGWVLGVLSTRSCQANTRAHTFKMRTLQNANAS